MRLPDIAGKSELFAFVGQIRDRNDEAQSLKDDESNRPLCISEVQLLTVVEAAQLLGVGRSKVYELMYKGELRSVKIGGSRRIRYSDLGEYVRYLDDAS